MSIAYVQSNQVNSSGTSVAVAFLSSNTAGNAVIAASRIVQGFTGSFSDNNSNPYRLDANANDTSGGDAGFLASSANIGVSPNNPLTVTAISSSNGTIRAAIHEFSGLAFSASATITDGTSTNVGNTNSPSSGAVTTTNAHDLLFGVFSGGGVGATVSAGQMGTGSAATIAQTVQTDKLVTEYAVVSSTGSYLANFSLSGAENWCALFAAYEAATAGAALTGAATDTTSGTGNLTLPALSGAASDSTAAQATLMTNYASVTLAAPLYTGVDSIVGPDAFWSVSNPVVGSRIFYDPTYITIHADGEVTSTNNNCTALAQFYTGSTWSQLLIVLTPGLVAYPTDTTSASGALGQPSTLAGAASDTTSATGALKGGTVVVPVLVPSSIYIISTLPRAFENSLQPRSFTVTGVVQRFDIKDPSESVPLTFNFGPDLATGETLTGAPTVSVTVQSGTDSNPTALLNGTAGFDSTTTEVIQPVTGGVNGTEYEFVVTCSTSNPNKILTLVGILPVRR